MSLRQGIFSGFIGAIWGVSLQNADYFGLPEPWGFLLMLTGAVLIGIAAPNYRRSGA